MRSPAPICCSDLIPQRASSFPSPGGPTNRRWSTGWPRRRAASKTIPEMLFERALPDEIGKTLRAKARLRVPSSYASGIGSDDPVRFHLSALFQGGGHTREDLQAQSSSLRCELRGGALRMRSSTVASSSWSPRA